MLTIADRGGRWISKLLTFADKGGMVIQTPSDMADVICEQSLMFSVSLKLSMA